MLLLCELHTNACDLFPKKEQKALGGKSIQLTGKGHKMRYVIERKSDELFATEISFCDEQNINQ